MGVDGCNALLVRALARMEADHPAVKKVCRINGDNIQLDGVAASIEAYGVAAVTAAVEALVATLLDALGRLIGEDMAIRIIDPGHDPSPATADGAQTRD